MAPTMIALLRLNAFVGIDAHLLSDLDLQLQQRVAARVQLLVGRPRALDQRALGAVEGARLRGQQRLLQGADHVVAVARELLDERALLVGEVGRLELAQQLLHLRPRGPRAGRSRP